MGTPRSTPNLGRRVFGLGVIVLGVAGVASRDFAVDWQHVAPDVPGRAVLAEMAAVLELIAGIFLFSRRAARAGALILIGLFSVYVLLWLIPAIGAPSNVGNWGNFFEETLALTASVVAFISFGSGPDPVKRAARISRVAGICSLWFGTEHLIYLHPAAGYVPNWIPPNQVFWVGATAVFFYLAGISILTGVLDTVGSLLLAVMLLLFQILVWIPKVVAAPHDHFMWSANGVALAFAGAAWVAADAIKRRGHVSAGG
ncbi:MAG TPA: hypothetical protein VGL42_04490 [Opitutaceae bacterium]|jgi:uncharacterized membrane protein YphA (DoxX/SURF4 family)